MLPGLALQVIPKSVNKNSLIMLKAHLETKLQGLESDRARLLRKIKALEVLLEDGDSASDLGMASKGAINQPIVTPAKLGRLHSVPSHAVRFSPRISLIGAVEQVAKAHAGPFTSTELLKALQASYPEFRLSETKHISSPLSDLVKRKVLELERKKEGASPNVYRAVR
jgi:hypothetical protein